MKKLLSYLAPVALLLTACASEPSDWPADKKVSLDIVPPGTRPSDNFDQSTEYAPDQAKGGAITTPVSSSPTVINRRPAPSAGAVMSANTQEGTAEKPGDRKESEQERPSAQRETGTGQADSQ